MSRLFSVYPDAARGLANVLHDVALNGVGSHRVASPAPERQGVPDLAGLVAVVSGGASGIGRRCAQQLAGRGARVVVADRDEGGAEAVAAELAPALRADGAPAGDHLSVPGDLRQAAVAERAVDAALADAGRLDAVVFSAGVASRGQLSELTDEEFAAAISDNLTVHFALTRAVLRHAHAGRWFDGSCSLVYVGSKHAVAPSTGFGAYPIAKAAELQLARVAALEGAAVGVRANVVNPGAVFDGSRFWSPELIAEKAAEHHVAPSALEQYYARRTLLGTRVTAEHVANTVCFLASPASAAITGAVIGVDGGLATTFAR